MLRYIVNLSLIITLALVVLMFSKASIDPDGTFGVTKMFESVEDLEGWNNYNGVGGAFSVMLPTIPQHAKESVPFDETKNLSMLYNMYVAEDGDGTTYMINQITYPKEVESVHQENILENIMSEMLLANPGNRLSKINMADDDAFGKIMNFTLESDDVVIESQAVMRGHTLFVLSVIDAKEKFNEKEYDYFVSSFKRK